MTTTTMALEALRGASTEPTRSTTVPSCQQLLSTQQHLPNKLSSTATTDFTHEVQHYKSGNRNYSPTAARQNYQARHAAVAVVPVEEAQEQREAYDTVTVQEIQERHPVLFRWAWRNGNPHPCLLRLLEFDKDSMAGAMDDDEEEEKKEEEEEARS